MHDANLAPRLPGRGLSCPTAPRWWSSPAPSAARFLACRCL